MQVVSPGKITVSAKQWHTISRNQEPFHGLLALRPLSAIFLPCMHRRFSLSFAPSSVGIPSDNARALMSKSAFSIALTLALTALMAGCASSPWSASRQPSAAATQPASDPVGPAPPPGSPQPEKSETQAMQEVMAELQQVGALDRQSQDKLMADLRGTDPALWPLVMQQFRAALAYRQRAEQRELSVAGPTAVEPAGQYGHQADHFPGQPFPGTPGGVGPQTPVAPSGMQPTRYATEQAPMNPHLANRPPQPVVPPMQPPPQQPSPGSAQMHLESAARALESMVNESPQSQEDISRHAQLRMIYLLAGRREDALSPIPTIAPSMQEFWSKELFGLSTWLDTRNTPDAWRAAETKRTLAEAVRQLGETAPLEVRNLAFCTEITGFGCITPFERDEFAPGQEVLLYAEVDNFASEPTAKGFHTTLRSSYQIFDDRGRQVVHRDCPKTEEFCRNARHDFFIGYRLTLPERVYQGKHTLQLTIEDLKSQKLSQASIEFTINEP